MFDEATVNSIVTHMNEDHADAVQLYLQVFAGVERAANIRMQSIDAQGMDINYELGGEHGSARVAFTPPLADAGEVRPRLVAMVKAARQQIGN